MFPEKIVKMCDSHGELHEIVKKTVEEIWCKYDKDNNGYLDKHEMKPFAKESAEQMGEGAAFNDEEFETFFKELDTNEDGKISKDEMIEFILKMFGHVH